MKVSARSLGCILKIKLFGLREFSFCSSSSPSFYGTLDILLYFLSVKQNCNTVRVQLINKSYYNICHLILYKSFHERRREYITIPPLIPQKEVECLNHSK